jgi:phosphoserine aminotransferase
MSDRVYNFSAGPAVLPVSVLERAQRDLVNFPGAGMSVLEMSHRSAPLKRSSKRRKPISFLLNIPSNYRVTFSAGWCEHSVHDGSDESADQRSQCGLHHHWCLGTGRDQGS